MVNMFVVISAPGVDLLIQVQERDGVRWMGWNPWNSSMLSSLGYHHGHSMALPWFFSLGVDAMAFFHV